MQKELDFIIAQLKDAYQGDPWFGRNAKELLSEVKEETAFTKLANQHSILELVWHMVTWREFTIDRLQPEKALAYFEETDWRELDHNDKSLWSQAVQKLGKTQEQLLSLLQNTEDVVLDQLVKEKSYDFRKLLHGLIQHDIYHLGQIAYINKCLKEPLHKTF
jgi:uncharacterized damage-inducible protein DinB